MWTIGMTPKHHFRQCSSMPKHWPSLSQYKTDWCTADEFVDLEIDKREEEGQAPEKRVSYLWLLKKIQHLYLMKDTTIVRRDVPRVQKYTFLHCKYNDQLAILRISWFLGWKTYIARSLWQALIAPHDLRASRRQQEMRWKAAGGALLQLQIAELSAGQ